MVKNLLAVQETQVRSLGGEGPPGEGNGYALQYSYLENPMDRGAWWTRVHGITKSRTGLKQLGTLAPQSFSICLAPH